MICTSLKSNDSSDFVSLLEEPNSNVNLVCDEHYGTTLLFKAIEEQNVEGVEILLEKGADAKYELTKYY